MRLPIVMMILAALVTGCGALRSAFVQEADIFCNLTPSDQEGPYYIADAPLKDSLYPAGTPGDTLIISGIVRAVDCTPLVGTVVDVWQADATGEYDFSDAFIGRGRVMTDANGRYQFETILPAEYVPRPPHIHYRVSHPEAATLVTQLYFDGGDNRGINPALIIPLRQDGTVLRGTFDIVLPG